jgi:signal peptidase I
MSNSYLLGLVIFILIVYIYSIQYHQGSYPQVFNDELINSGIIKTGDIICFKAYDNFNSIFTGSYFGHVGVIYVDPAEPLTPYLFEANGIECMKLKDHHSKSGIFLTPLKERMSKYKGRCFYKELNKSLSTEACTDFKLFINYCLDTMSYDLCVVQASLKKWLGLEQCGHKTNCGELTFMCLIKLGLLPHNYHDQRALNFLKWMCNIKKLSGSYEYKDLVHVIDHPFAN